MKIAFVGKGGSGKTTLASLFARHVAAAGKNVIAIDADINQHLGESLGMSREESLAIPGLGVEQGRLKEFFRGNNALLDNAASMIKTTPPGTGSRLISATGKNDLFDYFSRNVDSVAFMATGEFDESDVGVKCYHSKTGAVELLLNHLVDGHDDYIVVDMTAGADSFASGIFTRFDMTFLVVEPTERSIEVIDQYRRFADQYEVPVAVIGNKISDQSDLDFLAARLGAVPAAYLINSPFIKRADRGERLPISNLEPENKTALNGMRALIDLQEKDWKKFYRQAAEFHVKNAESWANEEVGGNLARQIDRSFIEHPERFIARLA